MHNLINVYYIYIMYKFIMHIAPCKLCMSWCRDLHVCHASAEQSAAGGPHPHTLAVVPGTPAWLWHALDSQLLPCCPQDHNSHLGLHMVSCCSTSSVLVCLFVCVCMCVKECGALSIVLVCPFMCVPMHVTVRDALSILCALSVACGRLERDLMPLLQVACFLLGFSPGTDCWLHGLKSVDNPEYSQGSMLQEVSIAACGQVLDCGPQE